MLPILTRVEKRHILQWLLFLLFICNTLVTLSMDIAIVSMVNTHEDVHHSSQSSNVMCPNTTFFLRDFLSSVNESTVMRSKESGYNWSKKEQNVVLSGHYWLSYLSILPASVLAQKYGSKKVVGISQGLAAIMSSLIPFLANYGYLVVAWVRAIQGFLSLMSVPGGIYTIIGNWSPPQERGAYGSAAGVGLRLGYAIGNFCFGYVAQYAHWQYIFHLTSFFGIIWSALWYMLIYDEPQKHPSISLKEKEYIESSKQKSTESVKESIPWKDIVTSVPVIVCILAVNSSLWCYAMIATYTPVYFKSMYGLNSKEIGILTSFPPLLSCIITLMAGYLTDLIIKKGIFSIDVTRKASSFIGGVVAVLPLLLIALTKCKISLVIICLTAYFLLKVIGIFGANISIIDMSPKFCGILDGIIYTWTHIQIFVFASLINYLSGILNTEDLWKAMFIFTPSFAIVTNLLYVTFGSSKVQPWNFDTPKEQK